MTSLNRADRWSISCPIQWSRKCDVELLNTSGPICCNTVDCNFKSRFFSVEIPILCVITFCLNKASTAFNICRIASDGKVSPPACLKHMLIMLVVGMFVHCLGSQDSTTVQTYSLSTAAWEAAFSQCTQLYNTTHCLTTHLDIHCPFGSAICHSWSFQDQPNLVDL